MVTKLKKEETAVELREKLGRTKLAIVADYRGLTVAEITTLRRRLRPENADFKVAKNTLLRRAVHGQDSVSGLEPHLKGPTGLALGYSDSPTIAKILGDFIREVKKPDVKIRGGLLDGKWITPEQVKSLAELPSREVLLAKLLGTMQAPLSGLVGAMSGLPRNFVYAMEQIRKQKEEAGGASAAPAAEAPATEAPAAEAEAPATEATAEPTAEAPAAEATAEPTAEAPAAEATAEPTAEAPAAEATAEPAAEAPAAEAGAAPGEAPVATEPAVEVASAQATEGGQATDTGGEQ